MIRVVIGVVFGWAFTLLSTNALAWTESATGICAGGSRVPISAGAGFAANYCETSSTGDGPLYGDYWSGGWSEYSSAAWLTAYSDMYGYPWGIVANESCPAGSGYVYYGTPQADDTFTFSQLSDVNNTCLTLVSSGRSCLTYDGSGCTNYDIWAANGTTIYQYEDGASGWGFYALSSLGYSGNTIKSIANFSETGYVSNYHNLWILDQAENLFYVSTTRGTFGGHYFTLTSSSTPGDDCLNVSITQDYALCGGDGVFKYVSGTGWSVSPVGDCPSDDYGNGTIGFSSGTNSIFCYLQGSSGSSSTATVWVYEF